MDDRVYRWLVRLAVILTLAWIGWSIYDGFLAGQGPHSGEIAAADRFFEDERYDEALEQYTQVLDADPDNLRALGGRAQALMQLGRNSEALRLLDQLIDQQSGFGPAYVSRGIVKDRMGDYPGAIQDYERGMALAPEVAEGPGFLTRFLRNQAQKPPTVADRARYLREQLAKPESERLLRAPEIDARQRSYQM